MKLRYITLLILTFLSITSYAQTNVINVDTNVTQVNITNYGNLIENNGGTVNIGSENKSQDKSWENDTKYNWPSNRSKGKSHSTKDNHINWDVWDWNIGFINIGVILLITLITYFKDRDLAPTIYLSSILVTLIVCSMVLLNIPVLLIDTVLTVIPFIYWKLKTI